MRSSEQVAAMTCPICRVPLAMSERQGIEIDYCPQCRGVWLDRGELDKIIERSASAEPPGGEAPLKGSGQDPWSPSGLTHGGVGHGDRHDGRREGQYGGKPSKRKQHWLSDLFD